MVLNAAANVSPTVSGVGNIHKQCKGSHVSQTAIDFVLSSWKCLTNPCDLTIPHLVNVGLLVLFNFSLSNFEKIPKAFTTFTQNHFFIMLVTDFSIMKCLNYLLTTEVC